MNTGVVLATTFLLKKDKDGHRSKQLDHDIDTGKAT